RRGPSPSHPAPGFSRAARSPRPGAWRLWHADIRKDRKSTRLNSSHVKISYAVFCLKKKMREQVKNCYTRMMWRMKKMFSEEKENGVIFYVAFVINILVSLPCNKYCRSLHDALPI